MLTIDQENYFCFYFKTTKKTKIINTEKKQWIAPQATEIEVNGGSVIGGQESQSYGLGSNGTIS